MQHVHANMASASEGAPKNETPAVAAARGSEDQGLTSSLDCRGPDAVGQADKAFVTLRASLALKCYSLSRTAGDDGPVCFFVTRWGMARELRGLADVARFLDQVGGPHA